MPQHICEVELMQYLEEHLQHGNAFIRKKDKFANKWPQLLY